MADDRKFNDLTARGDIEIDIDEDLTRADRGAVAAGDDVRDSAINTGRFEGIQNADGDVDADRAVIGDGNVTFHDSDVGAASFGRGDATNVEADNANLGGGVINDVDAGGNANVGSGTLIDVDSSGGGQTVVGSGNELVGDVDVAFDNVQGNANFALGDDNQQLATQDNDTFVDQSVTDNSTTLTSIDNSIDDSFNTQFQDAFNTEQNLTSVVEDNDVFEDNDTFEDNSTFSSNFEKTEIDTDLHRVDDTDIDIDS